MYVARRAHTFTQLELRGLHQVIVKPKQVSLTTTANLMHVLLQYINKSFNCGWKGPRQTRSLDWRSHSWRETCGPPLRKAEVAQVVGDSKKVARFLQEPHAGCLTTDCVVESSEIVPRSFRVPATEKQTSSWLHP